MVEKEQRASAARFSRVLDGNLTFPLWVQEIPKTPQRLRVDDFLVVTQQVQRKRGVGKNILVLDIVIVMLALEPLRDVFNFRKDKGRRHRIQRLGLVERCCGSASESDDVGKKFTRSSLGQEPLLDLRRTGRDQDDFDPRIFFLEGMPF